MHTAEGVRRETDLFEVRRARNTPPNVALEPPARSRSQRTFQVLGHQFDCLLAGHVADMTDPVAQLFESAHMSIVVHVDRECEPRRLFAHPLRPHDLGIGGNASDL